MRTAHIPFGRRVLIVTAHPDDESYCAAGTLRMHADVGVEMMLLCATRGEKGTSHLKRATTPAALKKRRGKELRAAARVLGIRHVIHADGGDGALRQTAARLYPQLKRAAKRFGPDVVLSFGPDGITGHRDHIAAGVMARRIARSLRCPFIAFALPPRLATQGMRWLHTRRKTPHYAKHIQYRHPTDRIRIDSEIKKRALRCHRSQMDGTEALTGYPAFVVRELLKREYFIR